MKKAVALLSGGIDSPVSIHLMKNKLEIVAVHFHQLPLTDEKEVTKVKTLAKLLNVKLYLVPFADVFKVLVEKCSNRDYYILSKIVMMKFAERIAKKENAEFLVTGENLAQVSSQTLSNLVSISKNVDMIILRPLLTYDKLETINIAERIGTFEISKGPEICCLLGPRNPSTKSNFEKIKNELEKVDLEKLFDATMEKVEIISS